MELAIASDLGISQHTVHTYLERVYRKLAVGSRVALVVRVMAEATDEGLMQAVVEDIVSAVETAA